MSTQHHKSKGSALPESAVQQVTSTELRDRHGILLGVVRAGELFLVLPNGEPSSERLRAAVAEGVPSEVVGRNLLRVEWPAMVTEVAPHWGKHRVTNEQWVELSNRLLPHLSGIKFGQVALDAPAAVTVPDGSMLAGAPRGWDKVDTSVEPATVGGVAAYLRRLVGLEFGTLAASMVTDEHNHVQLVCDQGWWLLSTGSRDASGDWEASHVPNYRDVTDDPIAWLTLSGTRDSDAGVVATRFFNIVLKGGAL